MAQEFVTDAGTLIIPGAYPSIQVAATSSGLSTTGVLMIVGEADAGPDFTLETDIGQNSFGPTQMADVLAKYKSGNLVDAFRGATAPMNDPDIQGAFNRAILLKTNPSTKATGTITSYATIEDKSYGKLGNLINFKVTSKTAEVVPSTGAFTALLPISSTNLVVRVNGGAANAITIGALETPATLASALAGVTGLSVSGGTSLSLIDDADGNLTLAVVSGNQVTITLSGSGEVWGTTPSPGDTIYIPSGSVMATSNAAAAGSYICNSATSTVITATKLLDVTGAHNALTPPTAKSIQAVVANTDVQGWSAITVTGTASAIQGIGKTLEFADNAGAGLLADIFYTGSSTTPPVATFFSRTGSPRVVNSSAEYVANLVVSRQVDSITESLSAGGPATLLIGYLGTTASMVNDGTTLTITLVGGAGAGLSPLSITLADFPTINDLAVYIGSLAGFTCVAGSAVLGSQPSISLDQGTFTFASQFGGTPGRIKQDAYRIFKNIQNNGVLAQLAAQPTAGQPAVQALSFLTGGTLGATTDAIYLAAMDALKLARGNFVVPLFSRDAADDISDGATSSSSTYTIAGVHAASLAHILQMRTLKARRNRQAFLSFLGTFEDGQTAAGTLGTAYCSLSFQDVKDLGSNGVKTFQPWMNAVKAAAGQAAAFYRPIFNKILNISGALQRAGDFNDQDDSKMEDALTSGMLPIRRDETGTFHYVSDQTTYGKDDNFVYNSIQAVYVADVIALTTAQRMEKAFVGQSVADISASLALSTLEAIMGDLQRLKLISTSDDAPKGFKNAKIQIKGPAMIVEIEVKLAGAIYFIPIKFAISQVQQSA